MKAIIWPESQEERRQEIRLIRDSILGVEDKPSLVHQSLWATHGAKDSVCIGDNLRASEVIAFVNTHQSVHSYVQTTSEWFDKDLETAMQLRKHPERYFQNPAQVVLPNCHEIWSWRFKHKSEKAGIREQLVSVLSEDSEATREALATIFEELFMNASLDAPREAEKIGRKALDQAEGCITLARSDRRLSLSCEDAYGTLNTEKFVRRMNEVYIRGAGQAINFDVDRGGAGLGCVLLFENAATLVLGVIKNKKTIVSCVIPAELNHRQRDQVRKSLHIVEVEG